MKKRSKIALILFISVIVVASALLYAGHDANGPAPTPTPMPTLPEGHPPVSTDVYTSAQITNIYTDKERYRPGDVATGGVTVENTGAKTIDDVTLRIKTTNKNYVWLLGERASTTFDVDFTNQSIQPNENKDLSFVISIPETVSGFSTAGTYEIECKLIIGSVIYDVVQTEMVVE